MEQIRDTMVSANNGSPVRIGDVATVTVGHLPRLGIAGQDNDDDIVQGIVLMRRGEQNLPTIRPVEAEVAKINTSNVLRPGARIEKIYDRTELIDITTSTVLHNMVFGIILIFLVQWLFLGDLQSLSPPPFRSPCSLPSRSSSCAGNRQIYCRWARLTSGSSSTRR
jgi:heavy metal efflux system protein